MGTLRVTAVLTLAALSWTAIGMSPASAGQEAEEKAGVILAEARKALGGQERLAAVKRLQVNATTRRANGNFNLEGDSELFFELPDKFRRNESLTIGAGGPALERKDILNGAQFTTEVSGGGDFAGRGRGRFGGGAPAAGGAPADGRGISPENQERLREFQRVNLQSEASRLLIALLLTSQTPFKWIGTAQAPEGTADVLEVTTPDGSATRLFIDTATRMPLMMSWTSPAGRAFGRFGQGRRGAGTAAGPSGEAGSPPEGRAGGDPAAGGAEQGQGRRGRGQGAPLTLEMHLSEYKTVNGIKLPHLITRGASGETNEEWLVKGYKVNPNFKADTFTK